MKRSRKQIRADRKRSEHARNHKCTRCGRIDREVLCTRCRDSHGDDACHDCGLDYGSDGWIEAVVPDAVWNAIRPRGRGEGCGILCITCMARRISERGLHDVLGYVGNDARWNLIEATPNLMWLLLTNNTCQRFSDDNNGDPSAPYWRTDILAYNPRYGISVEPMLGPVELRPCGWTPSWVICGGESGPGFRAPDPAWVRNLRDQCIERSIPFFFKQWGGMRPKSNGRELDGRTWDEHPFDLSAN